MRFDGIKDTTAYGIFIAESKKTPPSKDWAGL